MLRTLFRRGLPALLIMLMLPGLVRAELAVIANPHNRLHGVDLDTIARVYRGEIRHLSNGVRITPVDQPRGSPLRKHFYEKVLHMNEKAVSRYWSKYRFTGKRKPPMVLSSDAEVKRWVASHPDAIGYISGDSLDDSVELLQIIP